MENKQNNAFNTAFRANSINLAVTTKDGRAKNCLNAKRQQKLSEKKICWWPELESILEN